jgi:hypothetical protein
MQITTGDAQTKMKRTLEDGSLPWHKSKSIYLLYQYKRKCSSRLAKICIRKICDEAVMVHWSHSIHPS